MVTKSSKANQKRVYKAHPAADAGLDEEFTYYYETHQTPEDLMSESPIHIELIIYLFNLLKWMFDKEACFVIPNIGLYRKKDVREHPISPDVAVFKGVTLSDEEKGRMKSWRLWQPNRPAPSVVFEVSSESTWVEDINSKPELYWQIGVNEYYAYDPNSPRLWKQQRKPLGVRLRGWRREPDLMVELERNEKGWLWSNELDSWLGEDGRYLRLYDRDGKMRQTKDEAEAEATRVAEAAKELAWNKLRELGIDPESL